MAAIGITIWEDDKKNLVLGSGTEPTKPVQIGVGCLSQHEFIYITKQEAIALAYALLAQARRA